jgi:hypothetical protein
MGKHSAYSANIGFSCLSDSAEAMMFASREGWPGSGSSRDSTADSPETNPSQVFCLGATDEFAPRVIV